MAERSWIADAALALLAVVVIAFAAWVVVRDPEPPSSQTVSSTPSDPEATAADEPGPRTVVVFGDETVRGEESAGRWITELDGGEVEVDNRARPQSGYTVDGQPGTCGLPACPSLPTMLAVAAAAAPAPDLVLVSAGAYDAAVPGERLSSGITAFFGDLRAAYPDAEVVVLSPLVRTGALPRGLTRVTRLVGAEAEAIGAAYVNAGQPYLEAGSAADAGDQLLAAVDEVLNP